MGGGDAADSLNPEASGWFGWTAVVGLTRNFRVGDDSIETRSELGSSRFAFITDFWFSIMAKTNGRSQMIQAAPPSDFDWMTLRLSIASLVVAIVSFVSSLVSAAIANRSMKDAKRIADRAHDEWAQQKWFDLYFSTNSAYDAMEKLQADCNVQTGRLISIRGGENYPDRASVVIFLFREIQAMAMVFPQCTTIDMLCAATSGFSDDSQDPKGLLSKGRLKNLMDAMNDIREKALVDSSVLKRVIK